MKKIKTWLLSKFDNVTKNTIYNLSKLPYTKIFILHNWEVSLDLKIPSKIELIFYKNLIDLNKKIDEVIAKNLEYRIIPNFKWDANSRYAIRTYNKSFDTKIDWKVFKEKDFMINFLWDLVQKKFIRFAYKDLFSVKYSDLAEKLWDIFIIKPTNASSSTSTFKITCEEDFETSLSKISKTYDYILEEYIMWELKSMDFFMDWTNMFLLSYVREIAMIEMSDKDKFSKTFLTKYWNDISKHFNFILPISYNLDFEKLSKEELVFFESIRQKLSTVSYRWVIHMEYKHDSKTEKIWFIEWWARYWGYRNIHIKEIYNTSTIKIPHYLLFEKDFSRFKEIKKNIFRFKEKEHNVNIVRVKTNFLKTTNYITLLKKTWSILENSFYDFLLKYYKDTFSIKTKELNFYVSHNWEYNLHPFYKDNKTKFDYTLELNDENFILFKKNKFKIIEKVFFHDYK